MARLILYLTEFICASSCSQAKNFLHRAMINILWTVRNSEPHVVWSVYSGSASYSSQTYSAKVWVILNIGLVRWRNDPECNLNIKSRVLPVCFCRLGTMEFFPIRSHLLHPSSHTLMHSSSTVRGMTNICHMQFFLCLCFLFPGVIFHIKIVFFTDLNSYLICEVCFIEGALVEVTQLVLEIKGCLSDSCLRRVSCHVYGAASGSTPCLQALEFGLWVNNSMCFSCKNTFK